MSVEALPLIVRRIRREAPNIDLAISTSGPQESCQRIADDEIDLAIGVYPHVPQDLLSRELYRDTLICVADKRNKRLKNGRMELQAYLNSPHVTVAPQSRHRHSGRRNSRFDGNSAPDCGRRTALSQCAGADPRHRPCRAYAQAPAFGVPDVRRTSLCFRYRFR